MQGLWFIGGIVVGGLAILLCPRARTGPTEGVDRGLLLEFFLNFSRFEYSLKTAGFLKKKVENPPPPPPGKQDKTPEAPRAEAEWDAFVADFESTFSPSSDAEVRAASERFKLSPPWRKVVVLGGSGWTQLPRERGVSDLKFLSQCVKTVRNNLFHGGTYGIDVHETTKDVERQIRDCMTLLAIWRRLSPAVERAYDEARL